MKKKNKYSAEFKVITNIMDIELIPEVEDVSEEMREQCRLDGMPVIPIRIKTGNMIEKEKLIRENATFRKWIPDVRGLSINQVFNKRGLIERNKFAIKDQTGSSYIVKGSYIKFKNKLESLDNANTIGY